MESVDQRLMRLLEEAADARLSLPTREAAFKQLYELTAGKLHGLALRVVRRREWAEDVLQEAFITIWRLAGTYRSSLSPPLAWMGVIVRSRALDFLRRRSTEAADRTVELSPETIEQHPGDDPDPLEVHLASEAAWALHQCLRRLEARQREVLSLAYLRDLSQSELAAQLRLPLGTVKSWTRRGIEQLRGCMSRFA